MAKLRNAGGHADRAPVLEPEGDAAVPDARHLGGLLGAPVASTHDCIGPEVQAAVEALAPGDILLLENVRFYPGEEDNDPEFARQLASLAEIYVGDAFGTAHRAHASIVGVPKHLPAVAGLLMDREIEYLKNISKNPDHPFALVLGGAKVADKIGILNHLCDQSNVICVGGGVANTFLSMQGVDIADSLWDSDGVADAENVFKQVEARPDLRLYLPVDAVVGFGAAAALAGDDLARAGEIAALRDRMEARLRETEPEIVIFSEGAARLPNTSCLTMPGVQSETQVMGLDLAGVAVSAGSACSSGKVEPSHVLRALGAADGVGGCAIRVSMGWASTEDEIERFLGAWRALYAGLTNRWKAGVSAAAG
jgi:hypothetical protein